MTVHVVLRRGPDAPVEFTCRLACLSGRLRVGNPEKARIIDAPAGTLQVDVQRESVGPLEDAEQVTLYLRAVD